MNKVGTLLIIFISFTQVALAQVTKGIHLQAIARNEKGIIMADKQVALRITILKDSALGAIVYQEIISVTTNVLGLFFVDIGANEKNKIITTGDFENIKWSTSNYYLQFEIDPNNSLLFVTAGIEKMNYVPLALYAEKANTITSQIPIELGGTGVTSTSSLLKLLNMDKVNNTPDTLKPISNAVNIALNEKLKKVDTLSLSNRINQKLNATDTLRLSNRINQKLNFLDTLSLSNRINALNIVPIKKSYALLFDTSKQTTSIATATAIKFNFVQAANKVTIINNTAGNPTKITVTDTGLYQVNFNLQFIKPDINSDEVNVWIRKNNGGYLNTTLTYQIQGSSIKNNINGVYFLELNASDYIELFYSIKNSNSNLTGSLPSTTTPSKPATPSAMLSIQAIN